MYSIDRIRKNALEKIAKLKYDEYSKIDVIKDMTEEGTIKLVFEDKYVYTRKYDMEQCREVYSVNGDWSFCPGDDKEWPIMLNRMDYVYDLVRYSVENNDPKYAEKALSLILDWIDYHGDDISINPFSRTLDTGIRLLAWIDSIEWLIFMDLVSDEELKKIINSMLLQLEYLEANFLPVQHLSNWGLVQASGALAVISFTGYEGDLVDYNEKLLSQHIAVEFYNDGFHWELSSLYSIEVLFKLLTLRYEKLKNIEYYNLLERAAEALFAVMTTKGTTIRNGDGDEIDCRGILQLIYVETKSSKVAALLDGSVCEEIFWYKGFEAIQLLKSLDNTLNKYYKYFNDAKFICYKDYKRGTFLSMQNSLIGGPHGHFDNLHVNYNFNHKSILVDSGRGTYVDGPIRKRLKSPEYHNTLCVSEYSFESIHSMVNKGTLAQFGIENKKSKDNILAEAAYMPNPETVLRRKVLHLFNEVLVVIDDTNKGDFTSVFHFDREIAIAKNEKSIQINEDLKFKTFFSSDVRIDKKEISYHYNEYSEVDYILVKNDSESDHLVSFIIPTRYNVRHISKDEYEYINPHLSNEYESDLFEIVFDNRKYVLIVKSKYSGNIDNIVRVNDVLCYGSIAVIDCDTKTFEILKY